MFLTACREGGRLSQRQWFVKKWIKNLVTSTGAPPLRSDDGSIVHVPACDPLTSDGITTADVSRRPKTFNVAIEAARTGLRI